MMVQNDYAQKMQRCHDYVEALEQEQKKIQVFQRELPLCLELVTQAIEACRKELSGTSTTSEHVHGQSECSEQTTSVCGGPVFEEFIPIKKSSLLSEQDGEHESPQEPEEISFDKKKSDWLRSVQLWNNPSPDPSPKEVFNTERVVAKKAKVVEVKPNNGGAFQPFRKEKKRVFSETVLQPTAKAADLTPVPATTTSSTTEMGGGKTDSGKSGKEQMQQQHQPQSQTQTHRKQRRCWSPGLHRRFLQALQQLGGSHVATPKQIRDHMKVDGLTNDEVKSHLQKYRLHTRRPATSVTAAQSNENSQQPQFVVVGGIWVPSPQGFPPPSGVVNNDGGEYAPVATQPPQSPKLSVERSSGRCNSPAASSSTNTITTSSSPVS